MTPPNPADKPTGTAGRCGVCGAAMANVLGAQCPKCLLGLGTTLGLNGSREPDEELLDPFQVRRFGDYELRQEIARGGMGIVYRAWQVSLNRELAIKMILAGELAGREALRMFQREAHAAAQLHHPNIVPVYEIGEHETQHYFTMRFVPGGQTIADWAKTRRSDHASLAAAVAQVARAVAYAHSHGVLHRDLKPANILWDAEAGPQVTDFGLAKLMDKPATTITLNARTLGSPSYMAPEQAEGRTTEITTATDVYGLGAVLYELLAGRPPFCGGSLVETIRKVVELDPEPLVDVAKELRTICLKCLAKRPEDRYGSALAVANDLERFVRGEPISAVPLTAPQSLWRWAQRRPRAAALIVLAIGSLLVGTAGIAWQWRNAELARRGEAAALKTATATVVDLYTRSGLAAAKEEDPTRAALWFAQAAVTPGSNPSDVQANLSRWAAWRGDSATAVRAFESGIGTVGSITWSPAQDALILTGWRNPRLCAIWDIQNEKRWQPQISMVAASWLSRGERVVVASEGRVLLLDYPSGRELARKDAENVRCLAADVKGQWVAVGAAKPFLWDPYTGQTFRLPSELGLLTGMEFSRDDTKILLTSETRRGVCLLKQPEQFLFPPVESMGGAAPGFLGEGDRFITQTSSNQLLVLTSEAGVLAQKLSSASDPQSTPQAISPDGEFIGRPSAGLLGYSGKVHAISKHKNRFEGLAFSQDSSLFATASGDDTVRLWRLPDCSEGRPIGWHQEGAISVAISPDKRFVASGQAGAGLVRVWQINEPPSGRAIRGYGDSRTRLSRDGRLLIPSGRPDFDSRVTCTRVHAVETGEPVGPEIIPAGTIMDAGFAPDGSWVAVLCSTSPKRGRDVSPRAGSGTLTRWNFRTGEPIGQPIAWQNEPWAMAIHPSGQKIAVYGIPRKLVEVDVNSGEVRLLHENGPEAKPVIDANAGCRYSPDGSLLFAWGMGQGPLVWDTVSGKLRTPAVWAQSRVMDLDLHEKVLGSGSLESEMHFLTMPGGEPAAAVIRDSNWIFLSRFNSEGDLFLTAGRGRIGHVWNWRKGQLNCPALHHDNEVFAGAFLPGTECVATGGLEGLIRFWDRRTGLPLRAPIRQAAAVMNLAVTPDGRTLVSDGAHGCEIHLHDISSLLPKASLPATDALLLAELDAAAEVHRGSLEPLSAMAWIQKWQEFRAKYPGWHRW